MFNFGWTKLWTIYLICTFPLFVKNLVRKFQQHFIHLNFQVVLIAIFVVFFKTEMKRTKADKATVASSSGSSGGEVATSQTNATKVQKESREDDDDDLEGGALLEDKL